jgi:MFS family permease
MAERRSHGWFAGLTRNTLLLALASLFSDISTEMLYPLLPVYLTQTLRAGGEAVGLIEGLAEGIQNLFQGVSGSLSDRIQRRKPIALAGYALSAVSKPLIGLTLAWPGVLGARFADRLGAGTRAAPRDAMIAASVDEAHRGKAFGLEGAGDNAGAFLGPVLAVLLLSLWRLPMRMIFYLAALPGMLAFLMVLLVQESRTGPGAKTKLDTALGRFPRPYRAYLLAAALFGVGNSSNAFLILQTRALGASLRTTILIYAGFNLVAALVSYPAGAVSDRLGRKALLLLSFGLFLISYIGFVLASSVAAAAILFGVYGVFQGMFRTAGKALAADLAPAEFRASGIGWYAATVGAASLIASVVAGLMWDRIGHAAVFALGAVFALVGAIALALLVRTQTPTEARP